MRCRRKQFVRLGVENHLPKIWVNFSACLWEDHANMRSSSRDQKWYPKGQQQPSLTDYMVVLQNDLQVEQIRLANLTPHLVRAIAVQKEKNFVSTTKENMSVEVSQKENYISTKTQM